MPLVTMWLIRGIDDLDANSMCRTPYQNPDPVDSNQQPSGQQAEKEVVAA
jgi:hypothetical protein